jgi:hypothetical protein
MVSALPDGLPSVPLVTGVWVLALFDDAMGVLGAAYALDILGIGAGDEGALAILSVRSAGTTVALYFSTVLGDDDEHADTRGSGPRRSELHTTDMRTKITQ